MTLDELISQVAKIHAEMRTIALQTNIGERVYDRAVKYVLKYTEEETKELLEKLQFIKDSSYREIHHIYHLSGDVTLWEKYKLMGIEDLPEQLMFKKASKAFKKDFKLIIIPDRFNRSKKDEPQESTT